MNVTAPRMLGAKCKNEICGGVRSEHEELAEYFSSICINHVNTIRTLFESV